MKKEIEFSIWVIGIILGCLCISVFLLDYFTPFSISMLQYNCWIHQNSGLYCPGCGGTRAFFAVLRGDVIASFLCHPLVPYMGVLYAVFMVRGTIAVFTRGRFPFMKFRMGYIYVGIAVTLLQFLVKNVALLVFHISWLS